MTLLWITLTAFMFVLSIKGGLCYICTAEDLFECLEPLDDIIPADSLTSGYGYGHQGWSKETWVPFCSIYNSEVRDCLDNIVPVCTDYLKETFQGMEDGLNYVCNDGYQDLLKYADCMSSNATLKATQNCVNQLTSRVNMVTQDSKEICSLVDDAFDCVADVTEIHCGKEASEWVAKVDKITAAPLMDYMGCNKMSVGHLVGVIVGSIFGAAVLLTCVCCLVAAARKQGRNANSQSPEPSQAQCAQGDAASLPEKVGPPPSYSEIDIGVPPKYI